MEVVAPSMVLAAFRHVVFYVPSLFWLLMVLGGAGLVQVSSILGHPSLISSGLATVLGGAVAQKMQDVGAVVVVGLVVEREHPSLLWHS